MDTNSNNNKICIYVIFEREKGDGKSEDWTTSATKEDNRKKKEI